MIDIGATLGQITELLGVYKLLIWALKISTYRKKQIPGRSPIKLDGTPLGGVQRRAE